MFKIDSDNSLITFGEIRISFDEIIKAVKVSSNDIVYVGGSLVEGVINPFAKGMGNPTSDIDVFVIRNENDFKPSCEDEYTDSTNRIYHVLVNNDYDIEVTEYNKTSVYSLVNELNGIDIAFLSAKRTPIKENLNIGQGYAATLSFFNRLEYSVCIHNNAMYNELKELINYSKLIEFEKDRLLKRCHVLIGDVKGNLAVKELDVALYAFRNLMQAAMNLVIFNENMIVDRGRWVHLKFVNIVELTGRYKELFDVYRATFRNDLSNDEKCFKALETGVLITNNELQKIANAEV